MILRAARDLFERIAQWADRRSPQTLFARALIIIVVPMLLLLALSAWWFYSQRGDNVTNRLAILLVRDIRLLISLRSDFPDDTHRDWILRRRRTRHVRSTRCRASSPLTIATSRRRSSSTRSSRPGRRRLRSSRAARSPAPSR